MFFISTRHYAASRRTDLFLGIGTKTDGNSDFLRKKHKAKEESEEGEDRKIKSTTELKKE